MDNVVEGNKKSDRIMSLKLKIEWMTMNVHMPHKLDVS